MDQYPFSAIELIQLLDLKIRYENTVSIDCDCPFCNKQRKLNIHKVKGVFHCNYCDKKGNLVTLFAELFQVTNKEAYRQICETLHCGGFVLGYSYQTEAARKEMKKQYEVQPCATLEVRHNTYSNLLSLLNLTKENKNNLITRGLTERQIIECGFKSTPSMKQIPDLIEKLQVKGCTLQGVPGFYQKNGIWKMNFHPCCAGIFIPICTADGKIQGFQIRKNKLQNFTDSKYIWWSSSNYDTGTSSGSPIHVAGQFDRDTVYITEGGLKGTIAHYLFYNKCFISLAGVNQIKQLPYLLPILKKHKVKRIIETFDMDKFQNDKVMRATVIVSLFLQKNGFQIIHLAWDKNYKGIDDYACALKVSHEIKKGQFYYYDLLENAEKVIGKAELNQLLNCNQKTA